MSESLRVGCVPYLNARPLIRACPFPVRLEHPSVLTRSFFGGALDAALLPVFPLLERGVAGVVDGVGIGSHGVVGSVFLAYRGALRGVREVRLDPASMTSVNLLAVVLAEFHGMRPVWDEGAEARLLIGDQANAFRASEGGGAWEYLDLGEEWTRCTGLPFVYAAWALGNEEAIAEAERFREWKTAGLGQIGEIAVEENDPAFARDYLTRKIRFDLGEEERRGIAEFGRLLVKCGRLRRVNALRYW